MSVTLPGQPGSFSLTAKPAWITPDDLDINRNASANWETGFQTLSIMNRAWHVRTRGNAQTVWAHQTGQAAPTLPVIIVGIAASKSKQYYASGFVSGENRPPDCRSINGVTPDADSPNIQNNGGPCATCPHNQWGSAATAQRQSRGKACRDFKRLAVYPFSTDPILDRNGQTIPIEAPLLLSLPPTSVPNLLSYTNELTKHGVGAHQVVTSMYFVQDMNLSYPNVAFQATGFLDPDWIVWARDTGRSEEVRRMLEQEWGADSDPVTAAAPSPAQVHQLRPAAPPQAPVASPPQMSGSPGSVAVPSPAVAVAPPARPPAPTPARRAPTPAPTPVRASGNTPPEPKPAPTPTPAPVPEEPEQDTPPPAAATPVSVVQGVPPDMQSALDNLLAS